MCLPEAYILIKSHDQSPEIGGESPQAAARTEAMAPAKAIVEMLMEGLATGRSSKGRPEPTVAGPGGGFGGDFGWKICGKCPRKIWKSYGKWLQNYGKKLYGKIMESGHRTMEKTIRKNYGKLTQDRSCGESVGNVTLLWKM